MTHFRSYDVNSCDVTSRAVTFGHVTSGSHATYGAHAWKVQLCMTGSSIANGCDKNGSHVTGSHVIFPALFSYYSINIKCIIAYGGLSLRYSQGL
jgi:hypothetical protein